MTTPKKRSHDRAEGQTGISISIPTALLADIDMLARDDNRKRSNWIVNELYKAVDEKKAKLKLLKGAKGAANKSDKSSILPREEDGVKAPFTDSTAVRYPKGVESSHARETLPLAAEHRQRETKPKVKP